MDIFYKYSRRCRRVKSESAFIRVCPGVNATYLLSYSGGNGYVAVRASFFILFFWVPSLIGIPLKNRLKYVPGLVWVMTKRTPQEWESATTKQKAKSVSILEGAFVYLHLRYLTFVAIHQAHRLIALGNYIVLFATKIVQPPNPPPSISPSIYPWTYDTKYGMQHDGIKQHCLTGIELKLET